MSLKTKGLGIFLSLSPLLVYAQPWEFDKPVDVSSTHGEKIFHHLESAGRHNIAISDGTVAVAWEDDRDGTPRVYLARKSRNKQNFSKEIKISGKGDAYEPSLVALNKNRFVLAWEEDSQIHLRVITPTKQGLTIVLGKGNAGQPSLSVQERQLLLVYSQREGRYGRIWFQRIEIDGDKLRLKQDCAVDAEPAKADQLYPTVVSNAGQVIVAWEDRRPGHTIIMATQNHNRNLCSFNTPQRISEGILGQRPVFGKGHGVSRVALASYGNGKILAAWADKRNFREGHDIYAAHYLNRKNKLFSSNIKVQDSFGGVAHQWHATVAGDPSGRLVVGWDDHRDGNANIMLSWPESEDWSEDLAVPGADDDREQNHPTISLDKNGNLHLAWIERVKIGGPTRVRYLFGKVVK